MQTSDFRLEIPADDREFCAAHDTNSCAKRLRATEGLPDNELIYSMIWNADPTLPFPRGRQRLRGAGRAADLGLGQRRRQRRLVHGPRSGP